MSDKKEANSEKDFYMENGFCVFTETYHLKRGYCCGNGCRHCPFEPRHSKGSTAVASDTQPRP